MRRSRPDEPRDAAACRQRALDLLARREHGRAELKRKLAARGFTAEVSGETLDRLEQSGALADTRFTASFIESRAAKGQGPTRIRAELIARGIDPAEAAERLRTAEVDWPAVAAAVRRKRFGAAAPRNFKERARQARFLQYRGFDASQISTALGADAADAP